MKTIYVVTFGEYSDYRIDAIFTKKELAEKYIDMFGHVGSWNQMEIEEWEVNPHRRELRAGMKPFDVRMDKDGNTVKIERTDYPRGFDANEVGFTIDNTCICCKCLAKDEKHAIKITNERRAQYIALNKWGINKY